MNRRTRIVVVLAILLIAGGMVFLKSSDREATDAGSLAGGTGSGEVVGEGEGESDDGPAGGADGEDEGSGVGESAEDSTGSGTEITEDTEGEPTQAELDAALAASPYSLRLRVLDSEGEGLEVDVECFRVVIAEQSLGTGATASDGSYTRKLLDEGDYVVVSSLDGSLLRGDFEVTDAAPSAEVTLRYPGTASISGQVIATYGDLVDDVRGAERALGEQDLLVELLLQDNEEARDSADGSIELSSLVDADGNYRISGLAAGSYMLRIKTKFHVEQVRLDDGEQAEHDIHLGRGRISGRVTDRSTGGTAPRTQVVLRMVSYEEGDAELMAKAQLDLISDRLTPDDRGAYAFSNIPAGEYKIFSNGGGYGISKKDVTISRQNEDVIVDFVMEPGAVIKLAIQDLSGVDLRTPRASTQGVTWGFTGFVSGLNTGTHDVIGNAEGHEIQIRRNVVFGSEEPVEVTFKLAPAASTRLTFVDGSRQPLAGVRVSIPFEGQDLQELTKRLVRGSDLPFEKTGPEGWVQILGVKAGKCRVTAKKSGHVYDGVITLAKGVTEQTIEMTPSGQEVTWRVKVTGVTEDGVAHRAGLRVGDFIVRYNGIDIDSQQKLVAAIASAKEAGLSSVDIEVASSDRAYAVDIETGVLGVTLQEVEI